MKRTIQILAKVRSRLARFRSSDLGPLIVSVLVLAVCLYYAYLDATSFNLRANIDPQNWKVLSVHQGCTEDVEDRRCLQVGDQILQIGTLTHDQYVKERWLPLYGPPGQRELRIVYQRPGRDEPTIGYFPHFSKPPLGLKKYIVWIFPLMFWATGAIASVFLRPRNERWLVLVLLYYDVAVWGASGFMSTNRAGYAGIVFHVAIWLFLPLMVHLHLIFPSRKFGPLRPILIAASYATAVGFILYDHFRVPIPSTVVALYTFFAVVIALFLLVARLFLKDTLANRLVSRISVFGFVLGTVPLILLVAIMVWDRATDDRGVYATLTGVLFLSILPLWPFSYLYALYRHGHGRAEFRANRILASYGFFTVVLTLFVALFLVFGNRFASEPGQLMVFGLFMSLLFGVVSPLTLRQFRFLVDRQIYSLKYRPDEMISVFAAKIPTAFNLPILRSLITEEILPTLMVRQSALYLFKEEAEVSALFELGIEGEMPDEEELRGLYQRAKSYARLDLTGDPRFGWVLLMVPLYAHKDRLVGLWLLGRRDPDDFYSKEDTDLIHNLGNLVAPVIENVRLLEMARQEVAENRKLQIQLVQSQKMEAIGRLSAGVAHDFNNLLSVILGYSSLLISKCRDDESLSKYLHDIKDAGNRAASLTKQLLAFSRQQVMEARVMDLDGVVRDVEQMLRRLTGEEVELSTRLAGDLPSVKIDPAQMSQVVMNLTVNARDALPDGGTITISTHREILPHGLVDAHGEIPPGDYAVMVVADDGTGVAPDVLPRIFEPYFTTKDIGKGTGLGLSMVYGIINQSKGHIRVDSRYGEGTTFRIYLPSSGESKQQATEPPALQGVNGSGSETILLVEDEDSVRTVACDILENSGYRVLPAASGSQALESLRGFDGPIHLLLTDVIMPQMKGTELAELVIEERPEVRVLYMSGYNEESILGQRLGTNGGLLIQKPFDPETLARRVREVLDA